MKEIEDSILISDVKKYKYDNGRIYPWSNGLEKIKLLKERSIKIKTILKK
jgi:hypothetical protein|tara:strand:- start:2368 stop:2517 length:150 start_codon:yes stop_codon:yes gene_type:complete